MVTIARQFQSQVLIALSIEENYQRKKNLLMAYFPSISSVTIKLVDRNFWSEKNGSHNDRKGMLTSSYMLHGNCTRQCIRNKTFLFVNIESWKFQYLHDLEFHETSQNFTYIFWQTKKVLLGNSHVTYQNKLWYLEDRVVRKPCKQRTACT